MATNKETKEMSINTIMAPQGDQIKDGRFSSGVDQTPGLKLKLLQIRITVTFFTNNVSFCSLTMLKAPSHAIIIIDNYYERCLFRTLTTVDPHISNPSKYNSST